MIFLERPEKFPSFFSPRKCWKYLADSEFKLSTVCVIPVFWNELMFALSGRTLAIFAVCLQIMYMLPLFSAKFHICLSDHAFRWSCIPGSRKEESKKRVSPNSALSSLTQHCCFYLPQWPGISPILWEPGRYRLSLSGAVCPGRNWNFVSEEEREVRYLYVTTSTCDMC